ncbi:MAG: NAD(P)/FAD-dependent oxidoreductase [Halarchaeum sp.]
MHDSRVAVVGAGAVGLTAAFDIAARDATVDVYDRDAPGRGSTARAAGIAYDAYADDVDASLAARSLERFRALSGERGFRFAETPYLWFATDPEDAAAVREQADRMRERGRDVDVPAPADVRRRFPVMRADDIEAAALARNAGVADPEAYADLLAAKARAAGATVHADTPASVALDPPRVNGERYDAVVVTAGAWTKRVLADAGVTVPLGVYRAQALVANAPAVPIFYDATAEYYARPHREGVLAGDGVEARAVDPDDYDETADDAFRDGTRARLRERLVNADVPVRRAWTGVCTATPDGRPLLGELADGLYVGAGWEGHGLMRAPAAGERLAEQVVGERDGDPAFDPGRFDGDEPVALDGVPLS